MELNHKPWLTRQPRAAPGRPAPNPHRPLKEWAQNRVADKGEHTPGPHGACGHSVPSTVGFTDPGCPTWTYSCPFSLLSFLLLFWRSGPMKPRPASNSLNSWSSCLHVPFGWMAGLCLHAWYYRGLSPPAHTAAIFGSLPACQGSSIWACRLLRTLVEAGGGEGHGPLV